MRRLLPHTLIVSTLLLAACGGNPPDTGENASDNAAGAPQDRYTIRAGPVVNAQAASLSGTFQMLKSGGRTQYRRAGSAAPASSSRRPT